MLASPGASFEGFPRGAGRSRSLDQASFDSIPGKKASVKSAYDPSYVGQGGRSESTNYPWNIVDKRSHVFCGPDLKMTVNKCGCGSSWCPMCSKSGSRRRIKQRLQIFYWNSTRHVTLTIDRDQFLSGREAWEYVAEKKLIPNMIWNLRRTAGAKVIDWLWVLEWHGGWPHWHLFLQMEEEGRAGMLGGDTLRKYWPWGRWVREQPIYSLKHWRSITGYFDKNGYFEKAKGAQGVLPEWAKDMVRRIKRYGSMVLHRQDEDKGLKTNCSIKMGREKRTYRMILEDCGKKTRVRIDNEMLKIQMVVEVEYKKFREEIKWGVYYPGSGYFALIEFGDLALLGEKFPGLLPLIDRVLEIEEAEEQYFEGVLGQ